MASACNPPTLARPAPSFDPLKLLEALLRAFGITTPKMPTAPLPAPFCPLDP